MIIYNKWIILISSISCALTVFGQVSPDSIEIDSIFTASLRVASDNGSSLEMPEFPYKSPEAEAFCKYGNFEQCGFTGTMPVSLPVYTVENGSINIPISLLYAGDGIKVAQEASWVGLGWNLNVGGCINHITTNSNDNLVRDALWSDYSYILNSNPAYEFELNHAEDGTPIIQDLVNGLGQRDIYNVNLLGQSFSFFINPSTNKYEILGSNGSQYLISKSGPDCWVIKDGNGYTYTFDVLEQSVNNSEVLYKSAYYLSNIESPDGRSASLTYDYSILKPLPTPVQKYEIQRIPTIEYGNQTAQLPPASYNGTAYDNLEVYKPWLTSIVTDNQTVYFELSDRTDFRGAKKIDAVRVKDLNGNTVYLYRFNYGTFSHSTVGGSCLNASDMLFNDACNSDRLRLDSYSRMSKTGNDSITHRFTYFEDRPLPFKTSYATDFWGYYNGRQNTCTNTEIGSSRSLIPSLGDCIIGYTPDAVLLEESLLKTGANRFSDADYIISGSLKRIDFPTGGYTVFGYEPHKFTSTPVYPLMQSGIVNISNNVLDNNGVNSSNTKHAQLTVEGNAYGNLSFTFSANSNSSLNRFKTNGASVILIPTRPPFSPSITITLDSIPNLSQYGNVCSGKKYIQIPANTYQLVVNMPDNLGNNEGYVSAILNLKDCKTSESGGAGIRIAYTEDHGYNGNLIKLKTYSYNRNDGSTSGFQLCQARLTEHKYMVSENTAPNPENDGPLAFRSNFNVYAINSGFVGIPIHTSLQLQGNVGYEKITENEYDASRQLIKTSVSEYRVYQTSEALPNFHIFNYLGNGELLRQKIYDSQGALMKTTELNYSTFSSDRIKCNIMLTSNYYSYDEAIEIHPVRKYKLFIYSYPRYWREMTGMTDIEYTHNGTITTSETYTYNNINHQRSSTVQSCGPQSTRTIFKYPHQMSIYPYTMMSDSTSFCRNVPIDIISYESYDGDEYQSQYVRNVYTRHSNARILYQNTGVSMSIGGNSLEPRMSYKYDSTDGTLIEVVKDDTEKLVYLWSYAHTYPVMEISGATYSQIQTWVGINRIRQLSQLTNNPDILINEIRNLLSDKGVLIKSYTFKPLVGLTSETTPNGDTRRYEYDDFNRLYRVYDNEGKILQQYTYGLNSQ